jgi:hypothetical protein
VDKLAVSWILGFTLTVSEKTVELASEEKDVIEISGADIEIEKGNRDTNFAKR